MMKITGILHFYFQPAGGDKKELGPDKEKKKKETILNLAKYMDKPVRVKFSGGREGVYCVGTLQKHLTFHSL